jgi:hypothetical protein
MIASSLFDKEPYTDNRNFLDIILEALWLFASILLCHGEF